MVPCLELAWPPPGSGSEVDIKLWWRQTSHSIRKSCSWTVASFEFKHVKEKQRKHVPACAVKGAELLRACKQRVCWETRRVTTLPEPAERPADNRVEREVSLLIKVKRICSPRAVLFNCGHLDVLGKKSKQRCSLLAKGECYSRKTFENPIPSHTHSNTYIVWTPAF